MMIDDIDLISTKLHIFDDNDNDGDNDDNRDERMMVEER